MSKSWVVLIAISIVTMLAVIGFEFFQSLSGANVKFRRGISSTKIVADLGEKELKFIKLLEQGVLVTNENISKPGSVPGAEEPEKEETVGDFPFPQ